MPGISVIVAAAGSGRRMGGSIPKQYMQIDGLPVLVRTVRVFCTVRDISEIIVMCPKGDVKYCEDLIAEHLHACTSGIGVFPFVKVREGGETRQETVSKGLAFADPLSEFILVHDGARPYVTEQIIGGVINALKDGADCAVPCVSPKSTIRTREKTLDRSSLFEVQTPQGFKRDLLLESVKKAQEDGFLGTDEASLAERLGAKVAITEGSYSNIKITTPEDLPVMMRCGNGYDVHRLVEGRKLMLGCVEIPFEKGLLGHSDADVCSHAVADALLGAAALRDIGYHFPDNSKDTKGMAGSLLLSKTALLIKNAGFTIVNVDATIVAQRPKLSPYIEEMRKKTAEALSIPKDRVSIKATTEEGLGITGSGEAITTFASAMLSAF